VSDLSLKDILLELKPAPASYLKAERQLEGGDFGGLKQVNVAILATFTADLVKPYLVVESAAQGILARLYFGPFNQLDQQVLDKSSSLYQSEPDVVVIAARIEEFAPELVDSFIKLSPSQVDDELANIQNRIQSLIDGIREKTTARILVFNFAAPPSLAAGMADPYLEPSQSSVIQNANEKIAEICGQVSDTYVFDYAAMVSEFGSKNWFSPKLWYTGRVPFGADAQIETGKRLARYIKSLSLPACKCLVVDCDNTIWGGILGEEGLGGIELSEDYPGNVYKGFQRELLNLKDRGILLAMASKNNEEDVLEVFEQHADSLLKVGDFAATQIHWNDKATSLALIAEELNIGIDSLAFFDDNPVEREWVRTALPEVTVIDVPESPLEYIQTLNESSAFDQLLISDDDRARPKMYQEQTSRNKSQTQSVSIEEFLENLDMTATIGTVDADTLPRVAQLLTKTNQFNLTTRRHSESELQTMIDSGAVALWMRVSDRFGDNGLVAVAIAVADESDSWLIDTFLMSCRVIGRGVETAMLSFLSQSIQERGGRLILGQYVPTPQNGMVSEFYNSHAFESADEERGLWQWDLSQGQIPWPEVIRLKIANEASIGR